MKGLLQNPTSALIFLFSNCCFAPWLSCCHAPLHAAGRKGRHLVDNDVCESPSFFLSFFLSSFTDHISSLFAQDLLSSSSILVNTFPASLHYGAGGGSTVMFSFCWLSCALWKTTRHWWSWCNSFCCSIGLHWPQPRCPDGFTFVTRKAPGGTRANPSTMVNSVGGLFWFVQQRRSCPDQGLCTEALTSANGVSFQNGVIWSCWVTYNGATETMAVI